MVADGTMITAPCERFLQPESEVRKFTNLLPIAGFNLFREHGPALYAEFFMEGQSSLSNHVDDADSSIAWEENSPIIKWNFQNKNCHPLIQQLRNQWGFVIRPAQTERHLPPYRMYHYFDNYERYPDKEIIDAARATRCDVFVMHENWRCDTQNGGTPIEPEKFAELRDALHESDIRLAVYIRGNEESVVTRQADWFRHLLRYNFDGLYMDYGGPMHHLSAADESYCGGRIEFRRHYQHLRRLRETVGPDGLLYAHTGPAFSALGMSVVSGYISGEGERGAVFQSRLANAYFTMATVCPGTLWSAAFPEYASKAVPPYLAANGQYPHSPLGTQFASSSLVHPPAPGVNDQNYLPIWKIWSVLRREKDLTIVNDHNSSGVFDRDAKSGHYLAITKKKDFALLILSNFEDKPRKVVAKIDEAKVDFDFKGCAITWLNPKQGEEKEAEEIRQVQEVPEFLELAPYGVTALLFTKTEVDAEALLLDFRRAEPPLSERAKKYVRLVSEQEKQRRSGRKWNKTFLKIEMPELTATPYEDSMTLDLFNNAFELGEIMNDGKFRRIGWIGRHGFSTEYHAEENLFSGIDSPPVLLNRLFAKGKHRLALHSTHGDAPFYSFCVVSLSEEESFKTVGRKIYFLNDLEPDRSYLRFECEL